MPKKTEKAETTLHGLHQSKKQTTDRINEVTERTQRLVLEKFTDEQLDEFRELFNMFDKDNQGEHDASRIATVETEISV
jgi:Ca2+-binding EF-hand superfamily protein